MSLKLTLITLMYILFSSFYNQHFFTLQKLIFRAATHNYFHFWLNYVLFCGFFESLLRLSKQYRVRKGTSQEILPEE